MLAPCPWGWGAVAVATLLPAGRRPLGLWPGHPCPGRGSPCLQAGCPGGTFPAGDAKCCSLLGAPVSPPEGRGPNQPRDEGPLWLKAHGAGAVALQVPPALCRVSFAQVTHHPPPPGLSCLQPPRGAPFVLCLCPAQGAQGNSSCPAVLVPTVPVPLSLSLLSLSPVSPAAAAPQCGGGSRYRIGSCSPPALALL